MDSLPLPEGLLPTVCRQQRCPRPSLLHCGPGACSAQPHNPRSQSDSFLLPCSSSCSLTDAPIKPIFSLLLPRYFHNRSDFFNHLKDKWKISSQFLFGFLRKITSREWSI